MEEEKVNNYEKFGFDKKQRKETKHEKAASKIIKKVVTEDVFESNESTKKELLKEPTKVDKKIKRKSDRLRPATLNIKNPYNKFDLDFLTHRGGRVYNETFDVTDAPNKLKGVRTGEEDIRITDYMVYRPLPKGLLDWRLPPNVHPDSIEMEDFYAGIVAHSIHGVYVDGEYFNPLFMYWLNIFVFPVYMLDEDGDPTGEFEPGHPHYCNIDRYIFDIIWKAMLNNHDVAMMGGRGIGKSYIIDCVLDRQYRLFKDSWCIVSSTNEEMTNEAWNKVEDCMSAVEKLHKSLKHQKIDGGESDSFIQSGKIIILNDGSKEKAGFLSKIEKILYGIKPDKTRGKRPDIQHIEEFAAFPASHLKGSLRSCIARSRGSWYVGGSTKKCTVLYTGTGGSVENDEAEPIFTNPTAFTIEPTYDWERECGIFIPTHIKRSGTWEATGCPDVSLASAEVDAERRAVMSDPTAYISLLQEFPKTLKEVFMRTGSNIFNQDKLAEQRIRLLDKSDESIVTPEKGFLDWVKEPSTGKITGVKWTKAVNGDIHIIEHPYWVTTENEREKGVKLKDLYVSGCDSIDQGNSDSAHATNNKKGSELAMLVKKRILDGSYFNSTSNIYVAKYKKRSDDVRLDHDNALKLAVYYNSPVNIEYTKIGIVSHFRARGYYDLLMKRPTIALGSADAKKISHLIGTQASTPIIDHQDNKVKEYIDDNYQSMFFDDQLEQLQSYNREDRTKYDLVIATGLCELADEDKIGSLVKKKEKETDGFVPFGYYTEDGVKKYGVLPGFRKDSDSAEAMLQREVEAQKRARKEFDDHGGMRWIDTNNGLHGI